MIFLESLNAPVLTLMQMPMSIGDLLGFTTGIVCVGLTVRANIWNFPLGILNSAILGLVFLQQRLFADASLQIVFIVLSVMGWRQWLVGQHASESSPVFRTPWGVMWFLAAVAIAMTIGLWQILIWAKGSAPPLDALITALSLCAQWLLNRRALESWLWWIAVDVISIPLYWSRGLPLISALYVLFLLLCVKGWIKWRKQLVAEDAGVAA